MPVNADDFVHEVEQFVTEHHLATRLELFKPKNKLLLYAFFENVVIHNHLSRAIFYKR